MNIIERYRQRRGPRRDSNAEVRDESRQIPDFGESTARDYRDEISSPERAITKKTAQLPIASKLLYRIDFYTSLPIVSATVVVALAVMIVVGIVLGFPTAWMNTFVITVSIVTLLMVFTIQHTQGREQIATQRKLDELLRATPGAAEALMMLEEAPRKFMLEVEEFQREVRADIVDNHHEDADSRSGADAD